MRTVQRYIVPALLAVVPWVLMAQEAPAPAAGFDPAAVRAETALRLPVAAADETVGAQVQDYLVTRDGRIHTVVIHVQSPERWAGERFQVPAGLFQVQDERLVADVTADRLDQAGENGDLSDPSEAEEALVSVGQLRHYTVVNTEGESLGRIEGLMLNLEEMRLSYLAARSEEALGAGAERELYAVPLAAFSEIRPRPNELVLDMSRSDLREMSAFSEEEWPAEGTAEFIAEGRGLPRVEFGPGADDDAAETEDE